MFINILSSLQNIHVTCINFNFIVIIVYYSLVYHRNFYLITIIQ